MRGARIFPIVAAGWLAFGCSRAPQTNAPAAAPWSFADVAAQSGVRFVHDAGLRTPHTLVESSGPGLAWLDFDRDGWIDLFAVNGHSRNPASGATRGLRLWKNRGDGTFTDVTERAGLQGAHPIGMGVAVGDYDGDGHEDLYITCVGPNLLYRNRGNGTFVEVAQAAGATGPATLDGAPKWSTGACFFDADGDRDLDLYVANYCSVSPSDPLLLRKEQQMVTPSPLRYRPQADLFFLNTGQGRFVEASQRFGFVAEELGRGLGVLAADCDGDGVPEVFVGNQGTPNHLFRRGPGGRFSEAGFQAGVGTGETGSDLSARGMALLDADRDGRLDLAVSRAMHQPAGLFLNQGGGRFLDRGALFGLSPATWTAEGQGVAAVDPDLDGRSDLILLNEAPQRTHFFQASGDHFVEMGSGAGAALRESLSARSAATADFDNDGDLDVAVSVNGGALQLWRCDTPVKASRLQLQLRGKAPNTSAIGATVEVRQNGRTRRFPILSGGCLLGEHSRILTCPIEPGAPFEVSVRWPGTATAQAVRNVKTDQPVVIVEP